MARTAITPATVVRTGTGVAAPAEATGDVANGNSVANDGKTVLLVRNSNSGSTARVLTVRVTATVDGQSATARTYSIAAAASRYIGPFPTTQYGTSLLLDPDNAELKISALQISI
jgi:hypothetical protein